MKLLLALLLSIAGPQEAEADAFAAAHALKKEGKSAAAAAAFESLAQKFATSPRVGEALVEAGVARFAVARSLQVLHRSPPNSVEAFESARKLFARVATERPDDPSAGRAQYMLGSTALFLGDLPDAETAYGAVLERFPKDAKYVPKSLERRSAVRRHLLQNDLALADLQRYQKEFPNGEDATAVARYVQFAEMLGKPAPSLVVGSWLQGGPHSLESLRGQVVALYFFATWCVNCEKELPFILDLERRTAPAGLVWIGVFDSQKGQTLDTVRPWLAEKEIGFAAIMDPTQGTTKAYRGGSIPDLVLIDKAGLVRWHDHPANLCDSTVETLLGEEGGTAAKAPAVPQPR